MDIKLIGIGVLKEAAVSIFLLYLKGFEAMQLLHIPDKETKEILYHIGFFDENDVDDFLVTCRKIDALLEAARGDSDACRYANLADKIVSRLDKSLTGPNGELIIKLEPQELCSLFSIFSTFTKADMILYESLYGLID